MNWENIFVLSHKDAISTNFFFNFIELFKMEISK